MSFTSPWSAWEDRRSDIARVEAVAGGEYRVNGLVLVTNAGEAQADVTFPVRFIEIPLFTFGFSLADNEAWAVGAMPTVSGVVGKWTFGRKATGERYYDGAQLLIVTTGPDTMRGYFHYCFDGKALLA